MADPIEEFEQYRAELMAAVGDQDPIDVLARTAAEVRELTEGVPGEKMVASPGPEEWSAQDVLAHLFDADMVYGVRIRMILTQDRPPMPGFDQAAWTQRFAHLDEAPRQTLLRWRWLREANVRLYQSVTDEEWDRVGLHSERGEESVRVIVKMLAGHDLMHIEQLRKVLA